MSYRYNERQKKIIQGLLDQYENSKTYSGENVRRQTFHVSPKKVCPEYGDNFADITVIDEFERDVRELAEQGLVRLKMSGGEIYHIAAVQEQLSRYYEILDREEKKEYRNREKKLYQGYRGKHLILERFCSQQIARLEAGYKADYPMERAEVLLKLVLRILENEEELLEREISIGFFGDSKTFEKSYRRAACRILERSGDCTQKLQDVFDERERERILLGEHNIYANPSYIFVKGYGEFLCENGKVVQMSPEYPIAFSSQALKGMRSLCIENKEAMTIENLTSFHRMQDDRYFYIYLSGYHNTVKQNFIKRIAQENPDITWCHFGDIDPDGFFILEHLRNGTGIPFKAFHMGVDDLRTYRFFGKCLEDNDCKKAETLLKKGVFKEELTYMLQENIKLEQEVVSLNGCGEQLSLIEGNETGKF